MFDNGIRYYMYNNLLIKTFKYIVFAIILFTGTVTTTIYSQNTTQIVETEQYTGELTKKENNTLSIVKTNNWFFMPRDNTVLQYSINSDIKIKRDGTSSSIDKLQAGDAILVTQNKSSNELLSVDVISKGILDNSMRIILTIVALLLIAAVVFYYINKSNTGSIRTAKTN
jgi:hypothetical protein